MGKPIAHGMYPPMNPQTHKIVIDEGHFISNAYTIRS